MSKQQIAQKVNELRTTFIRGVEVRYQSQSVLGVEMLEHFAPKQ